MNRNSREESVRQGIEWPTVAVAVAIYAGFGLLTWHHNALPWWAILPLGAYLVAWHGSLQHEVVHGHPTRSRWVNEAIVFPSLWLWLPFRIYRASHLVHHRTPSLTDPIDDPESYLVSRARWQRTPKWLRALIPAYHTVPVRLLAGPVVAAWKLLRAELPRLARGDRESLKAWALHGAGCTLTLAWVVGACGIALPEYLLLYAFAGTSLTLLRSFAEHRVARSARARTAVVEAGPLMSLLYLNNNLHAVHHDTPGLPWYRIPAQYRQRRAQILRDNGGYHFPGYGAVIRRHWRTPAQRPVYEPGSATRVFQAGAAIG